VTQSGLFDLSGKVALVTGSTRGIGLAIAEEMARAGAEVIITSNESEACSSVAARLRDAGLRANGIWCELHRAARLRAWWPRCSRGTGGSTCWYATLEFNQPSGRCMSVATLTGMQP